MAYIMEQGLNGIQQPLRLCATAVGLTVSVCVSRPNALTAQTRPITAPHLDSLGTITTDTGALAPGRISFSRYDTPGFCLAAVSNARYVAQRSLAIQTEVYLQSLRALEDSLFPSPKPVIDAALSDSLGTYTTLPAAAIRVAQKCGEQFSVSRTPPDQLSDLLQLALAANNDTLARTIAERQLSQVRTPEARDGAWQSVVAAYLSALPARLGAARELIARADTSRQVSVTMRATLQQLVTRSALAGGGDTVPTLDREWSLPRVAYQFPAPEDSGAKDRVTAYVFTDANALATGLERAWEYDQRYLWLRQWHARFGSRLSIVIVTQANAYWSIPQPRSGLVSLAEEAQRVRVFFQDYLKLPVGVALLDTPFEWRAVDGARISHPVDTGIPEAPSSVRVTLAITDVHGHLRYHGNLTPAVDAVLPRLILERP